MTTDLIMRGNVRTTTTYFRGWHAMKSVADARNETYISVGARHMRRTSDSVFYNLFGGCMNELLQL